VNTGALWRTLDEAWARVLRIQTKLHQWATDGPDRRFDDLFNLVCDPAFLTVGWDRVRRNRGARTAGVDGVKPRSVGAKDGVQFLQELRDDLKARRFSPLPVRERLTPKASGKLRRLGIALVCSAARRRVSSTAGEGVRTRSAAFWPSQKSPFSASAWALVPDTMVDLEGGLDSGCC